MSATIFMPSLPSKTSEAARFEKCDESLFEKCSAKSGEQDFMLGAAMGMMRPVPSPITSPMIWFLTGGIFWWD
ncbi:hypothetical protein GJ744_009182 [Endocarpon pusillum]|uniref:Uncharacterized protein n=1 Tax=Endocarpon pusillum TaxID=364733 RepID=A0A8H7AHZ5_9EURO|nr:hypothetical protein GJ744_009182 [Endocarpon pusillum]